MNLYEAVQKRRMVRNFTDETIAPETLERILEAARRGPSAGFTQGQDFVVVTDPETRVTIAKLCDEASYVEAGFDPFLSRAPALIIPCTNENAYHRRYQEPDKVDEAGEEIVWPIPYWFMDVGAAVMILLLAVVEEGLAAAFVGSHHFAEIKQLLGIPGEITPVGVIAIGHPAEDKRSDSLKRGRREIPRQVHWEGW